MNTETMLKSKNVAGEARAASRFLTAQGFVPTEIGNLTAYLYGLAPVESGWTIDEVVRLLFVRHLVERKLIESGSTDVPIS